MLRKFIFPYRLLYMIVVLLVMLPGAAGAVLSIEINEKNFPDANLRSFISSVWDHGYSDSDGKWVGVHDGFLSGTEITDVTSLTWDNPVSANGIEYFPNLDHICCFPGSLTELNVIPFSKLKELTCDEQQLTHLNVSNNSVLVQLHCLHNKIESLNVSNNPELKDLMCEYNPLGKLDVSQNIKLEILSCSSTDLRELDLTKNTRLTHLQCWGNHLTELDLSQNKALTTVLLGTQEVGGLKVKKVDEGYEVCLKDYVSNVENIDISTVGANGHTAKLLSYDGIKGTVIFDECPKTLNYKYRTHSPNNDLLDVTIKSSMTVDVIERGGPTDNIIYGMNDKNYLDATDSPLNEDSISHLSAKKYGKKGFVADGNSRLILRVQTQRPGNVTFSLKENIGVEIERLSDRAKTNSFHTTEIGGNNYQASAVLVAPEMYPSGSFPSADFTVNVKFTADETGEDVPEEEKEAEENIQLEIHAAPVMLLHSFGGNQTAQNTFGVIWPALSDIGFNVFPLNYRNNRSPSYILQFSKNEIFNGIANVLADYIKRDIVCTKVDLVGYGMGGLLARRFCTPESVPYDGNYYTFRSYKQGMVRRIITIATPHRGTLWADYLKGDFAPLTVNARQSFNGTLAYSVMVWLYPLLKPAIEHGYFHNSIDAGIWNDLSVNSPLNSSFPVNVPMYSIYGRARTNINQVIDRIKIGLDVIMFVGSIYKSASKIIDFKKELAESDHPLIDALGGLSGNNNLLDWINKSNKAVLNNYAFDRIKKLILEKTALSLGLDLLSAECGGGYGVHPLITWVFQAAMFLAPRLVSGPGGYISLAIDLIAAVPYVIFGDSDYDCFVSEASATADFGSYSLGLDGWGYRHSVICNNQDVGLHIAGLLKSNKSMFKTFTMVSQPAPSVRSTNDNSYSASDDYDIVPIDVNLDELYSTHFELTAFPDILSVNDSEKVRITAVLNTDIEEMVYLVLQKDGYDSILPLISTDAGKFEISIEFTSQDAGTMNVYCFTEGPDSVYISNTVELNVKADLSGVKLDSLSFLDNTSGVVFTSANSDIAAGLYAKTSDGNTFDVSSPLMGTVWTSSNPSVAYVTEEGLIHLLADGSTTLTATYAGLTASIIVNVGEITSPEILTGTLDDGFVGRNYSTELQSSGTPLRSWRIIDGRLPDGLTLSDTGIISGVPSSEGTFTFTVEASNIAGSSSREFTITIGSASEAAVPIDSNNFPDNNFRNYIAQNFDRDNDGRLNDLEIYGIKNVTVSGMGINSLKGIEYFTAMEYLTCSNNNIAEIDLSHSPNFIGLACQDNQIESLNLTKCPKLFQIWFGNNKLTEIDFSGNPELSIIGGHNNMLAQLDVSVCEKLTELHCGENQLETLRLGNKPALLKLYCYSNKLKNLDIGRCTALQELHFGGNNVKEIDLTKNNELVMLHCWQNPLTVLNLSSCPKLTDLNCDESVKIVRTISISGTLSTGIKYAAYTGTLKVSGGVSPYTWRISSGALPDGLTIDESTGKITGTPTKAGTFTFKVKVTDKNSTSKTKSYTVKITKPSISGTLSNGIKYASYTGTLKASNGTSPYTWSISSGTLPDGLTIGESNGKISGTPKKAGTFKFTVKVNDKNNSAAAKSYTIKITKPSISGTLSNGIKYASYSNTLKASNGTSPYTWTISEGTLPNGLTLNKSTGKISGTPTKAGTFKFTVKVTDKNNSTATKEYTVKITKPSISGTLSNGIKYASYTGTLKASNGTSPYTWSISSGTLPDGLIIGESNGKISGTPTKAGTFNFTVKVTDKNDSSTTKAYTVKITKPSISGSLSAGTVGKSYSKTLKATGGTASYTWTKASGSLPSGLKLGKTTGKISGTPTKAGKFTFKIKVTDANGATAEKSFTVTIKAASSSSANEYTEEYETLRYSEDENESPEDILTVTLTPDEGINVKAEHDTHSYYVTGLSVMSDDVLSHGTDRDDDIVIVRANQPVKFIIGTWPHEVSDECVYVDDEPAEEIEIAEGRFTLPSEMIHDDFKICVKAQAGDSELESQEIYISAE